MEIVKDSGGKEYRRSQNTGICYHFETPDEVVKALELAYQNKTRLILDYGDIKTGKSWGEENDIRGTIGKSNGTIKIPLLIKTSASAGGGAILDHCIVKISYSKGGGVIYQHPNYKPYEQEAPKPTEAKKLEITPGKWKVTGELDMLRVEKRREDGSHALIAEVHTEDHNPPRYEEAEANARLIAAAPRMLKALKSVSKYLYYKEDNGGRGLGDFPHPKNAINQLLKELQ